MSRLNSIEIFRHEEINPRYWNKYLVQGYQSLSDGYGAGLTAVNVIRCFKGI